MKPKVLIDANLMERRDLRSGRIHKPDQPPKYGALYTSHVDVLEDDFGLDPAQLLGAFIGNADEPEESGKFLKIVGGYFYHDKWPDPGVTTKIFGIALDEEFGIVENGSRTIFDSWKHSDYPDRFLNEGMWTEKFGPHHGWTFITEYAEKEDFPKSYTPLKIFVFCPEILAVKSTIGDCVYDNDFALKRQVSFEIELEDNNPNKWLFEFGDESSLEGAGAPGQPLIHLYRDNPPGSPKLTLWYNPACEGISQEIDLDKFTICPTCPKIETVDIEIGECRTIAGKRKRQVTFKPRLSGDEPDGWIMSLGDGNEASGDGFPPELIEHFYAEKPTEPAWLRLLGPTPCEAARFDLKLDALEECEPCPAIDAIEHRVADETATEITLDFSAKLSGIQPDTITWNLGDDSAPLQGTELSVTHRYKKEAEAKQVRISLAISGPDECSDQAVLTVDIPALTVCPKISQLTAEVGKCESSDKGRRRKVVFAIETEGDPPESWTFDFGDGEQDKSAGQVPAQIEHDYYSRPVSKPALTMNGPELCQPVTKEIDLEFEECPPCPSLGDFDVRLQHLSSAETNLSLQVAYEGNAPDKFMWEWGDGSDPEITNEPVAQHVYTRLQSGAVDYQVRVTSTGPEDCTDEAGISVTIEAARQPGVLSKVLPPWIGLTGAFFAGNLLLRLAADFFNAAAGFQWLSLLLLLSGLVTLFSVILWYRLGNRLSPKPDRTNSWTAIGGFVAFSGFLDTIYIQSCAAGWWWLVTIALLVIGVYNIYRWITRARPDTKVLLIFLAGCLLAAFMNTLIVAEAVFGACLHP